MLEPGPRRASLRSLLGARCIAAAAADVEHLRRLGELPADDLIGIQGLLQGEGEAALEAADELGRLAGGEA